MPRSEFMSRRQTNSSHVSPSENTRFERARARAPIYYTCTREHLMLSPCRSSRFPAIYKEIASRTNVIFQTFPLHAPPFSPSSLLPLAFLPRLFIDFVAIVDITENVYVRYSIVVDIDTHGFRSICSRVNLIDIDKTLRI